LKSSLDTDYDLKKFRHSREKIDKKSPFYSTVTPPQELMDDFLTPKSLTKKDYDKSDYNQDKIEFLKTNSKDEKLRYKDSNRKSRKIKHI